MAEAKKTATKTPVKKAVAKKAVEKKAPVKKVAVKKAPAQSAAPAAVAEVAASQVTPAPAPAQAPTSAPVTAAAPTFTFDLQTMLEAGCHFGHKASKWHPKMAPYIYAEKDGIHLFDLPKTAQLLEAACQFVYKLGKEGKTMIIVGTKKQAREFVREAAVEAGCFHISARWMGGLLTNWPQVSRSIKRMEEIKEGLATDKYKGYTKYERVQLEKEQIKLERFFGGLKGLRQQPDCLLIVDPKKEDIAVTEARNVGVPVLAIIDTDSDPRTVDMVVPGNDDAAKSIKYFLDQLAAAYKLGRSHKK